MELDILSGLRLSPERRKELEPRIVELLNIVEKEDLLPSIEERAEELIEVMTDTKDRLPRLYAYLDDVFSFMPEEGSEHSKWMYALSAAIASRLGFNGGELLKYVSYSAVLHDIGKLVLPGPLMKMLENGDQLPMELYEIMKLHIVTGSLLLKQTSRNVEDLVTIPTIILGHHEETDGNGYIGLIGDEIPLVSKIISVVDSYLAIARKRSYDPKTPHEEVIEELKRCAGLPFDIDLLRRSNENKLITLREEDIVEFGRKGLVKYHERLKMKFERNTREGKRLPADLPMSYDEALHADLSSLEQVYTAVRLMSEYQFDGNVVKKFIEFATAHPKAIQNMIESPIIYSS